MLCKNSHNGHLHHVEDRSTSKEAVEGVSHTDHSPLGSLQFTGAAASRSNMQQQGKTQSETPYQQAFIQVRYFDDVCCCCPSVETNNSVLEQNTLCAGRVLCNALHIPSHHTHRCTMQRSQCSQPTIKWTPSAHCGLIQLQLRSTTSDGIAGLGCE